MSSNGNVKVIVVGGDDLWKCYGLGHQIGLGGDGQYIYVFTYGERTVSLHTGSPHRRALIEGIV